MKGLVGGVAMGMRMDGEKEKEYWEKQLEWGDLSGKIKI